jgi:2-polyprenyl-3-methyl-5-hydroxy-6-metoxy-1,4-benzoquinol methylase
MTAPEQTSVTTVVPTGRIPAGPTSTGNTTTGTTSAVSTPTGNTYDKYGTRNPIERRLMTGFFAALHGSLPERPPRTVLEVGVGEGEVSAHLRSLYADALIVGIDLPDPARAGDWRRRGLSGLFADAGRLPFRAGAFDLIMAIEVLEHVADPAAAVRELARLSRGHLVLSVPREPVWRMANMVRGRYLGALGNTPGHVQHWSRRQFTGLVGSQFDIVTVRTPFPWTMIGARAR